MVHDNTRHFARNVRCIVGRRRPQLSADRRYFNELG
jgi:hypothetical protein